ncbi:MAG: metallophosphoesterase, partial [Propionibacteriaceae bacterium]|nr:metallophosphoesterase [Propionibacteriaceae bacterium]
SISGRFVDQLVDQVNAAEPDLIVLAGDLVDGTVPQLSAELTSLSRLEARYGVVLTTGNHEFYGGDVDRWMRWWRDQGIIVLDNSGIQLTERGVSIDILGIHDTSGTGRHEPDLRAAAESLAASFGTPVDGAGRFRLLIAHEPRQALAEIDPPVQFGVDVMLSGHTHGGQLWPFDYAVPLQQPVVDGIHELQGVTVVTSTGVGAWGPPVRVLAQPEVVMVTLQPA